ncbi:MAG: site-specific recombinase XerD [Caballeronia mineralivorans]|nr:site-specific recombinase XerD [Caballeronia mineralivorans]MEA3102761.1 hypothetical protein [Caballeronia mineralivorans]
MFRFVPVLRAIDDADDKQHHRRIDSPKLQLPLTCCLTMSRETDRQRAHYFRARWLFTLLYLGGLRIPDVSANTMGRFIARCDADGHECWGLAVLGKGDKERLVSATNAMAAAHS